jgi:hypothetical protein
VDFGISIVVEVIKGYMMERFYIGRKKSDLEIL